MQERWRWDHQTVKFIIGFNTIIIDIRDSMTERRNATCAKGKSNFKIQNVKLFDPTIILPSLLEK